jgi:putative phosphoribosyl transferase
MSFRNRAEAAKKLAERLSPYKGKNPLVLAIPRGAVPMARILADALGGELDVVLVRKLGAPLNPELAVGSVDESGWAYVADFAASTGADAAYIEEEKQRQLAVMRMRRAQYTAARAHHHDLGAARAAREKSCEAHRRRAGLTARHPAQGGETCR